MLYNANSGESVNAAVGILSGFVYNPDCIFKTSVDNLYLK